MTVAIVHDYLTQRGGAERVVLAMAEAFPSAPIHTSLYDASGTFDEFRALDVRTTVLDRVPMLDRHHRAALPLLAPAFASHRVDADVSFCSSSGWAHGARVTGRKIVYCHAPARWLYQRDRYVRRGSVAALALAALAPALTGWDRRAARSADLYLANSRAVRDRIRAIYGIDAEVLHPPVSVDANGAVEPVAGVEPGFLLSVARLLPYKNVDAVIDAMRVLPHERLVVVGDGPEGPRLRAAAPANVVFVGTIDDAELRWYYESCTAIVAASYEDFGLVPVEAAAFGKPAAVLRFGGFLDTVQDRVTGVFFDRPEGSAVAEAVRTLTSCDWDAAALRGHADAFGRDAFGARLRELAQSVE